MIGRARTLCWVCRVLFERVSACRALTGNVSTRVTEITALLALRPIPELGRRARDTAIRSLVRPRGTHALIVSRKCVCALTSSASACDILTRFAIVSAIGASLIAHIVLAFRARERISARAVRLDGASAKTVAPALALPQFPAGGAGTALERAAALFTAVGARQTRACALVIIIARLAHFTVTARPEARIAHALA